MQKLTFVLVVFVATGAWASGPGSHAATFLKLSPNPRAMGMGEAQTGLADDVYAAYWNPAGLARLESPEAGFVHAELLEGIRSEFAAYAHPISRTSTLAGSLTHLSIGSSDAYDAVGSSLGKTDASDTALAVSFAQTLYRNRRLSSDITCGFTAKWIEERLDNSRSRAAAADAGLLYSPGRRWGPIGEGFRFGLAGRNVGSRVRFDEERFDLPRTTSAGVSWTGLWLGEMLTVALDTDHTSDDKPSLGGGIELSTLRLLVLRSGYTTKSDLGRGLRFGVGLRLRSLQIDYALAAAGALGQLHRIGLTCRFGLTPPDPLVLAQNAYEQGLKASRKGQYSSALVDFNKALELDPNHPDALQKMKETYEKLKSTAH